MGLLACGSSRVMRSHLPIRTTLVSLIIIWPPLVYFLIELPFLPTSPSSPSWAPPWLLAVYFIPGAVMGAVLGGVIAPWWTPVYALGTALALSGFVWLMVSLGMPSFYGAGSTFEVLVILVVRFLLMETSMLVGSLGAVFYRRLKRRCPVPGQDQAGHTRCGESDGDA